MPEAAAPTQPPAEASIQLAFGTVETDSVPAPVPADGMPLTITTQLLSYESYGGFRL